jgi:hypothetical protein
LVYLINYVCQKIATGVVHAKVGQIVTFFAYRPPSRGVHGNAPNLQLEL